MNISFDSFNNSDALNIGLKIIQKVEREGLKPVRIRIVLNGDIVFQYLMPGKKGVEWLDKKQKTVEKFKMSSYEVYLDHIEVENDSYAVCGGGYPLMINNELCGCIIVSGLRHDEDHQLIVDVLKEYKDESNRQ